MLTPPVLDLTSHFVEDYRRLQDQIAQLSTENETLRTRPAAQSAKPAPELEQRLAAAEAEVAALKKTLALERESATKAQATLARANGQVVEANRLVADLRTELNAVPQTCEHCDKLREQLRTRQAELQTAKSSQQALLERIRQLEAVPAAAIAAAEPDDVSDLKKELMGLRQVKLEYTELMTKYNNLKHKIETDRLKKLNP